MRTEKVVELRELFSLLKIIIIKYCEYEKWYERHSAELLRHQNLALMSSVNDLKTMVMNVQTTADDERKRAEEERVRAEEERKRAEEERVRAEERNRRLTLQIETNIATLQNVIAPRVVPVPINPGKRHRLGLYSTTEPHKWYLMRRQIEGWREAERRLERRGMQMVRFWEDVPHAVDVGNTLKQRCRHLKWYARGNTLETPKNYDVESAIDLLIREENDAHNLARDNEHVL